MNTESAILDPPASSPVEMPERPRFSVLGVRIDNLACPAAIDLLEQGINSRPVRAASVYFVNAHTINLAAADPAFRETLNSGDFVFGDGTGVRWAARLQGVRVADNLAGTDFVPAMFRTTADRGYSYFMLGADKNTIRAAADYARRTFPGWTLAGAHHGYLTDGNTAKSVIEQINAARPDVLLVGMGNPIQEEWIRSNQELLDASLCLGVGGLFDFWAGTVSRAPLWIRRRGHEWVWRLFQQPRLKARRYLIGNPLFLARVLREKLFGGSD